MVGLENVSVPAGVVMTVLVWGGFAALTGPEVAERSVAQTGWFETCPQMVREAAAMSVPTPATVPQMRCGELGGLMDAFAPGLGQELCNSGLSDLMDQGAAMAQAIDPTLRAQEAARAAALGRAQRASAGAEEACACAASVVVSDVAAWGVNAGTLRLAGGPADVQVELAQALNGPTCAAQY